MMDDRMKRLEREVKRLRALLIGVVLVGVASIMMAATGEDPVAEQVRAREIVLMDTVGHSRAVLGMSDDGPRLRLMDADGQCRAELCIDDRGPGLRLSDEQGQMRGSLSVHHGAEGAKAQLVLRSVQAGYAGMELMATKSGGMIQISDAAGNNRAGLSGWEGTPGLWLCDTAGRIRVAATADDSWAYGDYLSRDARRRIAAYDADRKLTWSAP